MFYVIKAKKIAAIILVIIIATFVYIGGSKIKDTIPVTSDIIKEPNKRIVVDAGHGEPDGGATSKDGIKESYLNLLVANKVKELLEENEFEVIMTRETEDNIADSDKQNTIRKMKVSDINNRVNIINNSEADMTISIHMNKFTSEKYYGWQTFYSKNSNMGKDIAQRVQNAISNNIQRENKRVALPINNIKIVDSTNIPVIIVECGFLSNNEDVKLLQTEEYRESIAARYSRWGFRFL